MRNVFIVACVVLAAVAAAALVALVARSQDQAGYCMAIPEYGNPVPGQMAPDGQCEPVRP